jgi:hypothetical protein
MAVLFPLAHFPALQGAMPCYAGAKAGGDAARRPQETADMDRLEPSKLKEPNNEPEKPQSP